jgi:hypothetical protein
LPIVASRAGDIRRLLKDLNDSKRRAGAVIRLRSLGARVTPHVADEIDGLDAAARDGLLEALQEVQTADAKALKKRLVGDAGPDAGRNAGSRTSADPESRALDALRTLPPPRHDEPASVSRERGEAHLVLARTGSRLARKELLQSMGTLGPERARLYCEAAGLIGDGDFLAPLARLAAKQPEALAAISLIAAREKITPRSKILRTLDEAERVIVAKSIAIR